MAYALDDTWDNCGPVARAGNAAFGVYVRCGIWVARNLTDGFVPGEIASAYGSPELARKLVDVGLWEAVDGGYVAVDYLTRNPTADKVRARLKADADRKARWREKQAARRGTSDKTRDSAGSHGVTDGGNPRSPTTSKEVGGARPATQGAARAPTAPNALSVEHEPGCGRVSGEIPPDRCPTCLAIRAGPADDRPNGGPADPDQARRVLREIAARAQPTARALLAAVPDPPTEETA